ncbi:MAG: GNAT family N-acetyltransferase [Burkholderiales bacterium]|nr:GNAT family N-acetyltransferase [Burkholderiales bacterium]
MTSMPTDSQPPAGPPDPSTAQRPATPPWIPIRSLGPGHRPRILAHLQMLDERDRYLRFGYQATDEQIARYVETLDFERDEIYGVFNRRLDLIAMAHLACPATDADDGTAAEFGVSVRASKRGQGHGGRLFEHAVLHARNRGLDRLFIHALSENTAMLRIARKAGAEVQRSGAESDAYLKLPHETLASHVEAFVEEGAAALDYQFKRQAQIVDALIDAIAEVKTGIGRSGHSPSE